MKKVLSFVLAAIMVLSLSVSAFAWNVADVDYIIPMAAGADNEDEETIALDMVTDKEYVIGISTGAGTAKDFKIAATVKKGADVVKVEVKADDKKVTIKTIPDYTWSLTKSEKFEVVVKVVPAAKAYKTYGDQEITFKGTVTLLGNNGDLTDKNTGRGAEKVSADNGVYSLPSGNVYKLNDYLEDTTSIEFPDMTAGPKIWMEYGKVYEHGNVVMVYNQSKDKNVQKMNLDAELFFYNFVSAPEFDKAGKLYIEANDDEFIYEIVDGKLVASKFAWDEEEWAWALKTNVLGSYVVSDKELEVAASDVVANPSTGASDMVNVAVAMAVVSIAAAGAVALKK